MDRKSLKLKAREQMRKPLGTLIIIVLIVVLAAGLLEALEALANLSAQQLTVTDGTATATFTIMTPLAIIAVAASVLVSGAFMLSLSSIFLKVARKGDGVKIVDLKTGFEGENVLRGLFGFIRYEVFTFLWSLLFVIPGIVKALSYSQMFYLMADNKDMSASEAQIKSMQMMLGHKGELFVMYLSFIPWILLGAITCGVALFYVIPYMETSLALFYEKIKE